MIDLINLILEMIYINTLKIYFSKICLLYLINANHSIIFYINNHI